jgi:hypothetical protein
MVVDGQRHTSVSLPPGKRPGTRCIEGWVVPSVDLNGCGKCRPLPGFDTLIVQPVASRYTD